MKISDTPFLKTTPLFHQPLPFHGKNLTPRLLHSTHFLWKFRNPKLLFIKVVSNYFWLPKLCYHIRLAITTFVINMNRVKLAQGTIYWKLRQWNRMKQNRVILCWTLQGSYSQPQCTVQFSINTLQWSYNFALNQGLLSSKKKKYVSNECFCACFCLH